MPKRPGRDSDGAEGRITDAIKPPALAPRKGRTFSVQEAKVGNSARAESNALISLPADVAQHVGVDVQADVGHVVEVLAGDEPHDFADVALGKVLRHAGEC